MEVNFHIWYQRRNWKWYKGRTLKTAVVPDDLFVII